MVRNRRLYIAYTCDYDAILDCVAFIILLETTDSLRYFCIIVSLYIIYWYKILGRRTLGLLRLLRGFWWQWLRLACLSFVDYYILVQYYIIFRKTFIFLLVCNYNILVILVCKLSVLHVAQILSLCVIIYLHYIYLF
jgi:hypothetical protein